MKSLAGITEDQKFGAMCRSSAIFWEEEEGENQVISMNAQVAQSLSMAITSHCVVEDAHCSKRRTRETKDGPGGAPLLELDLHLQTASRLETLSWKPPAFTSAAILTETKLNICTDG